MALSKPFLAILDLWIEIGVRHATRDLVRFSKEYGLSMSQLGAMFRIRHQESCGVSEIGEDLGVTSAAASQMIDRLVQQGLITRAEDPNDRRAKQLYLTEKGDAVLQASIRARQEWLSQLAERLSPEEQSQIAAALSLLVERAAELDRSIPPEA